LKKVHIEQFESEYMVTFFREQLLLQLLVKRIMDIVVSTSVLVVFSPVMALVALIIKATSPGSGDLRSRPGGHEPAEIPPLQVSFHGDGCGRA
jgi:lipopolysaccharide/colanic/teichoic acid biosynthesis glycosyltransferase